MQSHGDTSVIQKKKDAHESERVKGERRQLATTIHQHLSVSSLTTIPQPYWHHCTLEIDSLNTQQRFKVIIEFVCTPHFMTVLPARHQNHKQPETQIAVGKLSHHQLCKTSSESVNHLEILRTDDDSVPTSSSFRDFLRLLTLLLRPNSQ